MKLLDGVTADATLSPCGVYRYALTRQWYPRARGHVLWIMLNPSTADADIDDRTVRRCIDYAKRWGYDGITVANLFALRATDPRELLSHPDPVGAANDDVLRALLSATGIGIVVAGWGAGGTYRHRHAELVAMASREGRTLHALAITKAGQPRHPLYLQAELPPTMWRLP